MGKYIKYYNTHLEYDEEKDFLNEPNISWCELEEDVHYGIEYDYSQDYLTFVALEDGTFSFSINNILYSLNNGSTWTTLTAGSNTPTITAGSKIIWKASGLSPQYSKGIGTFSSTNKFIVRGNILSLVNGDNFIETTQLQSYLFEYLFKENIGLISVKNLVLSLFNDVSSCYGYMFLNCSNLIDSPIFPSKTTSYCYTYMFSGCTSLVKASDLLATTATIGCYLYMFYNCTNLKLPPKLSLTTLSSSCCRSMFNGCTNLIKSPELLATTLLMYCYSNMFVGCIKLKTITCLATNISAIDCVNAWLYNASNTGTFIKAAVMEEGQNWSRDVNGIPTGWTVQTASS